MPKRKSRFKILFKKSAQKDMAKLERNTRQRISDAIAALADNPYPVGSLKLSGFEDYRRIRVGSFRIVYQVRYNELIIFVIRIADRKDVYKNI